RRRPRPCGHDARLEQADHVADGSILTRAYDDLAESAILGSSELHSDLVRLDHDEHLVMPDYVPFLLQPFADLHFRDRLSRWRYLELDGHLLRLLLRFLDCRLAAAFPISEPQPAALNTGPSRAPDLGRSPEMRQATPLERLWCH